MTHVLLPRLFCLLRELQVLRRDQKQEIQSFSFFATGDGFGIGETKGDFMVNGDGMDGKFQA